MRQYTAGFNGNFPTPGREWRTVTKYLSQFDGQCSINACTLIPNGNVRMEVMGLDPRKPTADELQKMRGHRPRGDGAGRGRALERPRLRAEPLRRRG